MKKTIRSVFLIALSLLLLVSFVACGGETAKKNGSLQVNTIKIIPTAYENEPYDLREVILMEDGVKYSATACYIEYIFDAESKTYSRNEQALEVEDLCFTPTAIKETVVTITATKGKQTAQKVILVPTSIHADPLDELYQSSGLIGGADNGITKSINQDPAYIQGENSATSLHVEFNTVDPHAFGNTFLDLGNEHAQKIFTDQVWDNAIVTFWVYNPMEKPIEFQLAIMDNTHEIMTDWNPADGPHRQFAQPGQWTQIFFSLRAMGTKHRLTNSETSTEYLSVKMQYEDYSLTDTYTFDFYLDNLDVVPASMYPEIDTTYTMSDETLEDGWENMIMDIGWQGALTTYDYEEMMGENSICSLRATFPGEKGKTNSFICLSPETVEELKGTLDMTGGKLSAYFKFENMEQRVSVDILNSAWQCSNQVDMTLTSAGNGWYYGELDLEKLQVGTGRNDNIIRIRFHFYGVKDSSVVYMDTCKFEYKHVNKVLESPKVDLINMTPDVGGFYCNVDYSYVTSHLQGGNSVRSLKVKAPSGSQGRFTWNTQAAAENGEISAMPNMTKGTMGAWFYFGDQAPEAGLQVTSSNWQGSREVKFVFTKKGADGWYYGELHGSDITFFQSASSKGVLRWTLIIPAGYTVYVDNLSWKANTETELVAIETPKPVGQKVNFKGGEDVTIELGNTDYLATLSFDYKINSGEKFAVALLPDWLNSFGYFDVTAAGCEAEGVTLHVLKDGYLRLTFDLTALNKKLGNPSNAITMLYIRGDYTDASGVIENITWTPGESNQQSNELESGAFTAGVDKTINLDNTNKLATLSFDYKITSGEKLSVALLPNWENYYGYFDLPVDENAVPGVTSVKLDNGYTRVTFAFADLIKYSGTPSSAITTVYIRGEYTEASGLIENVTWTEKTGGSQDPDVPDVPIVPEDGFLAGADKIINLDNTNKLATLSFDYKITSGEKLSVALLPNWENYYGYFDLPVDENAVPGVTSMELDNGYTRVTFTIADLIKYSGTPSSAITTVYIRGVYTDASGLIENITWTEMTGGTQEPSEPTVPSEPETEPTVPSEPETEPSDPGDSTDPAVTYEIGAGLSIDLEDAKYEAISFEYKITNGGELSICALSPDWAQYYGYFAFGANGAMENNPGITCEDLGDGYYRVTMVCAELERTNNSYNTNNAPSQIGLLYTGTSTATGTIRNVICYVEYNGNLPEEPEQPTEPSEPTEPTVTYEMGAGLSIDLEDAKYEAISFEYKITNGGELVICALSPDWAKYYGYYGFGTAGSIDNYNGITYEVLSDGYIRVTMNMAQLDRVDNTFGAINGPEIIGMLYMSNGNTATGTIRNVMVTAAAEDAPNKVVDGRSIVPGTDYEIYTECDKALTRVTFDYKVTAGTFNIALLPNWENYYGYFAFNENGNVDAYDGVTCKDLGDGYYRVTLDMDALTKYSGNPTPVIELLFIRGNWSEATGEITNICLYWDETKQLKKVATPMAAHALCALVASGVN